MKEEPDNQPTQKQKAYKRVEHFLRKRADYRPIMMLDGLGYMANQEEVAAQMAQLQSLLEKTGQKGA